MYRGGMILVLLAFTQQVAGQSRSYIQTDVVTVPQVTTSAQVDTLSQGRKQTSITYLDGLGRPIQQIAVQASPLQKDMVQPIVYNNLGQQVKSYMPYVSGATDGAYRTSALSEQSAFYQITTNKIAVDTAAYSQQIFENSPLVRLLKQGMVGTGYHPLAGQHYKTMSYRSNTTTDNVLVWSNAGTTAPGYYAANVLSVTDAVDEQNIETLVFTDMSGHTVLKRQVNGSSLLDTYYIYNLAGMISYVVPPKAVDMMQTAGNYNLTQTGVNKLLFKYVYDALGRTVEKTIPAAAPIYVVYDTLSRPVLIQNGNLRDANQWNYIKYDLQGRAISQGIYTDATNTTRAAMQAYVTGLNYSATWAEQRNGVAATGYYTNSVFPTVNITPLAYAYFDDYDLNGDGTADYTYQPQSLPCDATLTSVTTGLATVIRTCTVGAGLANIWLTKVTFYDTRQRPIQTIGNNHLNTIIADVATTVLNFVNKPTLTKVIKVTSATTTVLTAFSYDTMYRLAALDQTYNSNPTIRLASYEYNEIGQLVKRNLHSVTGGIPAPANVTLGTANAISGTGQNLTVVAGQSITLNPNFSVTNGATFSGTIQANTYLQSVDYRYNIRGQMTSINNSTLTADGGITNGDTDDVFGMEISYDQAVSGLGNTPSYNGQLTAVRWMSVDENGIKSVKRSYKYNYDQLNRQLSALYQDSVGGAWNNSGAFDEKGISYDKGGNILGLKRNALIGSSINPIDSLTYLYDSINPNQLKTVTDGSGGNYAAYGFKNLTGSTGNYVYDDNGNLTTDPYKGLGLQYNTLNKPQQITVNTATGRYINYTYDASGTLLRKQQYDGGTLQETTDYSDGFVYENGTLAYFGTPEGRVRNAGGTLISEYTINDQQGNARISFINNSGVAQVVQEDSYYGFGLVMPGSVVPTPSTPNRNLYNGGSEWQNDYSNLPDYYQTFNRNYDAALGRFISVDPEAESTESLTTYNYSDNNPIMFNDPMGNFAAPKQPVYISYNNWDGGMIGNIRNGGSGGSNSGNAYEAAAYANWSSQVVTQNGLLDAVRNGDPNALALYAMETGNFTLMPIWGSVGQTVANPNYVAGSSFVDQQWQDEIDIKSTIIGFASDNSASQREQATSYAENGLNFADKVVGISESAPVLTNNPTALTAAGLIEGISEKSGGKYIPLAGAFVNYYKVNTGQMGDNEYIYEQTGIAAGMATNGAVGAEFGGPYGALAGITVGTLWEMAPTDYNFLKSSWNSFSQGVSDFNYKLNNSRMPW